MKRFFPLALVLVLTIGAFFIFRPRTQAAETAQAGDIVFSEIMWSGSFAASSDEWIELYNNTDRDIDLLGWQITRYSSVENSYQENLMLTIGESNDTTRNTIVPAQQYFLISNYDKNSERTVINVLPDIVDKRVSLLNSKLQLKLYNGNWEEANPIDIAGDKGQPLAGDNSLKASMIRILPPQDGTLEENWSTSEASQNLKEDSTELATPENSKRTIANLVADPQSGNVPLTVVFDASNSMDLSESGLTFEWDTESEEDNFAADVSTETPTYEYTYETAGDFLAALKVSNNIGSQDIVWLSILVQETAANQPPTANFSAVPTIGTMPLNVIFDAGESSDDKGITSFLWDFGDGNQGTGEETEHTFNQSGTFTVQLTVKDEEGLSSSSTAVITVQQPEYSEDIMISELYPKPNEGSSAEFIELYNNGECDINLENWQLDDIENGGSAPYTIPASTTIPAGGYLSFTKEQTKISLNDGGDQARLIAPDDQEKDKSPNYGPAKRGWSYSFIDNEWKWTKTVTKNSANVLTLEENANTDNDEDNNQQTAKELNTGSPGQIIFSELLPFPSEGEDEFIELYNPSEETVDITGWALSDASGRTYKIKSENFTSQSLKILATNKVKISGEEYFVLERDITGIALNNHGGDTAYLLDEAGNLIDKVSYSGNAKQGVSYALDKQKNWQWTSSVTPGEENIITVLASSKTKRKKELIASGLPANVGIPLFGLISTLMTIFLFHKKHQAKIN